MSETTSGKSATDDGGVFARCLRASPDLPAADAELARLTAAWPNLPEAAQDAERLRREKRHQDRTDTPPADPAA
jgi:hypothetical protein